MRADIVIVGGGVIGWSAAYHLTLLDPTQKVVVIDRNARGGQGSTGFAAGGVRAQFSTEINIRLSLESIAVFERFKEETGEDPSFRQHGYLFVTATEQGARHLAACGALQRSLGVWVDQLDNAGIRETADYLAADDLVAGSYAPKDGYLDPYAVCRGFENAAKAAGASAIYNATVLGGSPGRVDTNHGPIECGVVLLCPGHWAGGIAKGFGIQLPVSHEIHMLAMTGPVLELPEALPMVVDLDTSFHFRREGSGLLIGCNWETKTPVSPDDAAVFDFGFLPAIAEHAMRRLTLLEHVGFDSKRSWAGYYAQTPDRHAIIGETDGVFVATGFGGHGVMHSPAAGRAIAQLMLTGRSDVDVSALRPSRFAEGDMVIEEMVI